MSKQRPAGADWIRSALKIEPSPLGVKVADLLGIVYGGIYNAPLTPKRVNWSDDQCVIAKVSQGVATHDDNKLTKLVLGSHALAIRLCIGACNPQYIELMFHHYGPGAGFTHPHPTIDQAVAQFRRYYGYLEEATQ